MSTNSRTWWRLAAATGLTMGLVAAGLGGVARADYQPSGNDVVGVVGETAQYTVDFVASGDTSRDAGYNSAGNLNRLVSIDATADSNGRAAYADGSTLKTPVALNPSVVLRAGTSAVQRPTSSGSEISAILADTGAIEQISFVRSSSLPTPTNQQTAANNHWGYLHVVQVGTDPLVIVAAGSTNSPPGLSIADLLAIYTGQVTTWNKLSGNSGGSSDTIVPMVPPSTSAIYKTFLADLTAANGNNAPTFGANVVTVEQNDPTAITTSATPADAIAPFAQGRLNLWNGTAGTNNKGYFINPNTAFAPPGTQTPLSPGIKVLSGTPPEGSGATAYQDVVPLDIIFRESDASDGPWQPGGKLNWVQTLFSNPPTSGNSNPPLPYFATAAGQALVAAAGGVPGYSDLGDVSH